MLKINVVLVSLLFSFQFLAQEEESSSKYKPSFGFNIGLNQSALFNHNDTETLEIKNTLGLRLGVLADFQLNNRWSISPKAELSFNNGRVTENNVEYSVDPAVINFALHAKYRYNSYTGRFKPYSSFGPSLRVPVKPLDQEVMYNTIPSLGIDFSFGVDIDMKHFIISPELRFSGGLTDIRQNPTGRTLRGSSATFTINFMSKR